MSSEYEPRFTEPLKAAYLIREGQPVKLSCRFEASPKGNIQWLKEGVPIDFEALGISRDFKVVKEVDFTALLIKESFPEDTGSYTVVIRNSLGEARSFTQLTVEEYFCRTPESEMSDTPCKPVFVQPLLDMTINEGDKLKLHAAINAYPESEIIWYRNDIPLKNSRDLILTFDGQLCTLIKDRCEKENDTGIYRITAVNSVGQAESVCQVVIQSNNNTQIFRERIQSNRSLPGFIQSLQNKSIQEGEKLLFQIQINGQPKPQVIWYKDNQPLRNTHNHKIRTENDIYILEIPRLSIADAGFYQVKAINTEGEATCSATVNILPKILAPGPIPKIIVPEPVPKIIAPEPIPKILALGSIQKIIAPRPIPKIIAPEPMIIESAGHPPEFLQLFNDRKTSIGSTIKFEARVIGTQPLNVYWLFNGSPITRLGYNQHYQQNYVNDTYTLIINNVRYEDVGRYSLNAENSWGKVTCSAELFIPPTVSRIGSPSSSASLVQVRTITRRITSSGNSDNSRGTDNSKNMLSDLLVKMSPSPPLSRKRQIETNQQQQESSSSSSFINTRTYEQESSFKRSRPLTTRQEDYRRIREYPKKLQIYTPLNTIGKEHEKQMTITRSYEYEGRRSLSENAKQQRKNDYQIEQEYLRCLDDLTNEYEKLNRQKQSFNNQNKQTTYERKESYEHFEEIYRPQPIQFENTYQRSLSEDILHKRLKPIFKSDFTLSQDDLFNMQYQLKHKERLKPIHIHSSTNSIPGETSIKYVHTERSPVEVLLPKPQIITTHGEHSSTIVKDIRHSNRKITTNIHQQPRRRTIEGLHELRIIERPITSGETYPVEFTIPKPIPAEHSSTFVVKSKKGGRFHTIDISKTLTRERTISGEHEFRVISEPIRSNLRNKPIELLFPKPTFSSSSSSHSSTIVKQNRTPISSLLFDNIQTTLKGEHELRLINKPIESASGNSVELIVPKSVRDIAEHKTTIMTETQPHRRVLEITGSGRKMESEHERKYYHDKVHIEEEIQVKLPKQKREQVEHSATIIKHSRGKGPIIEIDTAQRIIQGEHETKFFEESIETKADTMELLIAKPKIPAEHSTTIIKGQRGKPQRFQIDHTQPIPGEYETKYYEQPVQSFSEMEVVFSKQQQQQQQPSVGEHTSTLIKKVHSKQIVHPREIPGEHVLTIVDKSDRKINNEMEFIIPKPQKKRFIDHYQSSSDFDERFISSTYEEEESSGEHSTTYLKQARAKYEPIELVVDRPKQLPSISKLITDIQSETQITSIRPTKILYPEDSSVKLDMELNNKNLYEQYDEMEIVLEKPIIRDSSTTLIANIQPGLELKSIHPTQQQQQIIEESTSTFTLQRQQKSSEEDLLEFRIRKPYIQDSSSILLANIQPELGIQGQLKPSPYFPQTIEDSSSTLDMELNTKQQISPFELIIPRIDVESSTTTILAQVAPTIAGLRAKVDVPEIEKSTSSYILEQKKRFNEEVELIMPKPRHIETSTSTMIADIEAKLETKNIRPSQIQPDISTSTFYFEETTQNIIPQPVEIRMKQPTIADSSTTLLANVKATLDTQKIQKLGKSYQPLEQSSSIISFETKSEDIYPSEVELILPRPQIQESTSVMLADIRPTLDTSQKHIVIPPPLQSPIKSSSEIIFDETYLETTPVELHLHRQPSSHTLLANIDDSRIKNKEMYVLGTGYQQEQQYGTSTIHADLNKPIELILNVDEGNTSSLSQQYRRDYKTKTTGGIDSSSTFITEIQPVQYQPVEFVVSGGLTGYDQYSTGTGGYTTTTTTKRKITSIDSSDKNRSVIRGIRPYDQVDLVLQPEGSSSTKVLTTSIGLDRGHSPYFSLSLHDQTAQEGESVLFEVIVSAQPSAEIIWDKDGELIGDDSSFRIDYYGDGRATLYIPEAFLDDQGYYTCTATNTYGTSRTTARLTIDSPSEGISPKRRQLDDSSIVYYQQGPRQTIESYRIYSQPSSTITKVTEETEVYQIPSHQQEQQHNEITYSIQGTQPKFQPVSFLVSSTQENIQPTTTTTTDEDEQSMVINPYQIFGTQLHTRPNQNIIPSYGDETSTTTTTTTRYSQQQPRNTGLIATVAKQPGPTIHHYQQSESDSMQTESDTSTIHLTRSIQQQQPTSTSYTTTRPNFTKPLEPVDALEGGTVQITVHLPSVGSQQTRPQIQWYHHAQPIIPDNQHYRITEGYDTSTLEIINVKKADSGQVWCVANTPAGSATTTCTINVEENPVRTHHQFITSQQQVVPQETIYTTQSIHSTHAQIPLHHQQQPEQRVSSQYYTTQQQQISPQSMTPLSYQPEQISPQSYTSYSSQQPKQQQQQQPEQISPQSYTSYSSQQPKQQQPEQISPQSYTSFSPQQPKQQPQAPFQPYTPQEQSPLQIQEQPQSFIPQAPPLLPNFNIRPNYSDQQVKILNNGLQDQPLYSGAETVFECQFTGQPDKVQWFRNEVEIINNSQQLNNRIYHVTNLINGTSRLIIKPTLDEDIGTYSVKLTGPNVEDTTSAKLIPASQFQNIQKKKVEQAQRKALVQELEEKQLKRMRPSKPAVPYGTSDEDVFYDTTQRTAAPQRQPTAPMLTRPLKDLDVKEGQPIQLTCQAQGFPKSELLWFKNNLPLPLSARHKIAYEAGGGNITLRVNDSRPEDSGVYTVIAKNPQGLVQTSARVDVIESPGIDETSYVQPDAFKYIEKQPTGPRPAKPRRESDTSNLQQKPAKILKTPMNTSVVEGGTATLTCQVEGTPKPKIAWLKDNKPLMSGTRFSTYFDQPLKTAILRINDVCKEDQGYYTCIVDNPLNSDQSTATLQVIPESKIDQRSYVETDAFKYLAPENKQLRTANKENDRRTSGVDSESFVNPDAFRYLETKKPLKEVDDNLTIDDRPIIDVDAFRYLEARQAPRGKKDQGARASIDDTPIIAPDAFRYLERKADATKLKKDQDTGPSIDETPQVNLTAFQYLERKEIPKKPEEGPGIDESSIVNPEAFKYLERKPIKKPEDAGPSIDETPLVNPDAFRYLERPVAPKPRDTAPNIDTTPLVNPEVFKYLERPTEMPRIDEGPSIDTRSIVPQEAFRWLDRPKQIDRKPEGPSVDESSYVNPQAFRYIEAKPKTKVVDEGPSIDESSYVNPQAFKYLETAPSKKPVDQGPTIDTSTYVNPQLFEQFDQKPVPQIYEEQEIKRAPRVIQPLKSAQANEGKPIALVAIVDGYPVPQLTWLKDGAELPASNRVTTNYDIPSKTAWIRIDSVRPDDSAVYTLMAHNPAGEVRSDARLNVVPSMTPIDDTAFVPAEAFAKIERATAPNRSNIPTTTGVDDTAFVNPQLFQQFEVPLKQSRPENFTDELVIQVPARIISPLKSIQAPESVTVVLEAIVEGSPIPTFTWLKDQLPLSESNRFITNYDLPSKRVTLTIKDVRENDTGIYTLLASNGPQLQHSTATLQIIGAPSIDQSSFIPMDVFKQLERPQNQQPQIPVQSGVDQTSYISQPDRFAVFDQIQPHRKPLNDFGGVDETPLVSMEKIRLLEIPSNLLKQPYDVEEKSQAPIVLTPLQPIDAQEGSPVVLTAKIAGTPMPNFTWFKDDAPLVASSRFTTYYDIPSKLIVLQINDARPDDTGVYKVRADNKSGDAETSATLNISLLPSVRDQSFIPTDKFRFLEQSNQPRFIEEISGVDERPLVDLTKIRQLEIKPNQIIPQEEIIQQFKPTILIPLRNVQAIENQPVVLSAQIEGRPQPQFIWFKNDQPLSEGNRFRTHYDIPSKTIFLTIAGAREDDSGIYRLVAKNPSGEDETSCQVTVDLNQPNIDQRSFVPQTAFDKLERPLLKLNNVTSGVDQTSFFNQDLFRPFDERHIKHPSAIVGGEESDAAMPISPPKVLIPLRPITTTEGDTVLLTTQVEGYPLPQFTWVHNNKPIMASNRVTPHYDMLTKRCYLQIFDSRPSDAGTYELIAENPAGHDRTKTELTIVPVSKIDQTGYVPYDKFSTLEFKPRIPSDLRSGVDATPFVSGEIFRLLEAKPINEQFAPEDEQNVPLEVLVPLKPAVAQEGQPVILTTKIRGRPTPQFTWLRNNQPLMESNRFQTHYDFPSETLVLEVSDIWPHDSGTYTVIAENPKTGEHVETSAPLTVRGDTTTIDRTAFVAPDAFRPFEQGPTLRTVMVESGVDTNSFLSPDILRNLDQVKPRPMDTQEKEQPLTAPKVLVPLQPIKCNEGQPINFITKVEGNPTPTFTWFKNGQPLQESNRFWSHYDVPSKTVLLQINGARPDDSGTYTLVAKNPLGQDQTQATVNVSYGPAIDTNAFVSPEKFAAFDQPYGRTMPTQSGVDTSPFVQPERFTQLELKAPIPTKEDMEQMEAPRVITPLQSVQVNEGTPVLLQATVVGKPRPNFVWLKDGAPLVASNRLRTRYDIGTKQVLLQINDARPHDIGEYLVIATNPAGEDSTVASLSVLPDKTGVDDRAFVPTDKFRNLEHPQSQARRPLEIVPGVDVQPFVSPDKFRNLDHVPSSTRPEGEFPEEKRAPRVIHPLSNCDLEELMPVLLTTTIDAGSPMATFTWFKNSQPLLEGNRFTTNYDILTKTLTLQILAARPDDQGVYTVRATNPSGSDETTCKLAIRPVASIDTRPFVQPERFAPLELKAPIPKKEDMEQMQPPKVIVPLQNEEVKEGSPVLLRATIVGKPTPNFVWLKDGAPLAASNRLRTRYDIGTKQVLLQIDDVRPQDVGEYLVIATNPAGEDSTVGSLSVLPDKPGVDDRAFVPKDKFRNLEHPQGQAKRPLEIIPGVDIQPFISPDKFRNLDHVPPSTRPDAGEIPEEKRPPRVIVPLTDHVLEELMPVILTTTIDAGVPMASFTWFKNGQPLLEGNRYTTKYDIFTKILTLQILAVRPDDQGVYTVRAINPVGSDETTCKLTIQPVASIDTRPFIQPEYFAPLEVKAPIPTKADMEQMQPPKVIVPLPKGEVKEGAPVLLQATIIGKPTPNFVWLKDGAPLAASNRLRTRYDIGTKQVLLQINDVRPQDVGEYLVIATNPAGQDSTVGSLSVLPDKPGVDDRPFLPTDKFRNLEHPQGQAKRPLEIIPGVDVQPFISPDKFRNLDHVPPSTRPDAGQIPEEKRPPRVIVPLNDHVLEELMPVLLTTTIDAGVPMASFTWFKNGQPLLEGNRYTTKYDIFTKILTLQILAVRPDDQGVYTVRAINPVGSDETTCKLTIQPVASIDTRPFVQPEHFAPLEVKAPIPTKEDMEQMQPPKVIVPLPKEEVKEGSPVLLRATIIGKPTPNFVWLKDGAPLAASNRLRTRYDIGTKQVLLQIDDVRPQDVGEYLVIATNPAGKDSTVGSLSVLPDKPGVDDRPFLPTDKFRNLEHPQGQAKRPLEIIPGVDVQPFISPEKFRNLDHVPPSTRPDAGEIPEAMRPPRVIVPLNDCVLEELMPVLLTTTIDAGVPMASFTWFKNGQPLLEGNRYTTKYDIFTKLLTLQILAVRPDDQGVYTVRATNPVGSDETTCKLTIQPVASIDTRPFVQPEHFAPLEVKAPIPTKEDMDQMQPPKVIVPLPKEEVKEGAPVLLRATIIGKPTPNFVWLKDGAPLAASNRLRTRYDIGTKQVLLQINDVRPQDVGEYLVIATNPAGEDSTVGSLSVLPDKPGVDDRAFVPKDKFRNLERPEGSAKRPLEIVPGVDVEPFISPEKFRKLNQVPPSTRPEEGQVPEAMRPPRVIVPLSDCVLEELMPVLLTATIDAGVPMASFTWFKNGQPLLEGNRFTTKYDIVNQVITLQILASRPDDQGVYTVRATNPVGSDETTCKLTIRPVSAVDTRPFIDAERFRPLEHRPSTAGNLDNQNQPLRPPKVLVPMNNVRLTEYQPIVLKSIIDAGFPMGKFTWLKDGRSLPESNRYRANFDINTRTASLFIDAARPATDTGRYTVHVENIVGKDQTTGDVHVEGTPGIDERPFIEPSKFGKFEGPLRAPTSGPRGPILQPDDSLRDRENLPPWIRLLKELEDQLIDETKAAQLVCLVDAHPPATINWFKDGQPLIVSQRFMPDYDYKTGLVRLTIYPVYAADSGQYTMVARNIAGEVSTKCTLRIQPTASIEDTPLVKFAGLRKTPQHPSGLGSEPGQKPVDLDEGQKPYFIKIPVDQEVPEGQLVRLDYIPAGRPEPTLAWYRNGIPLRPDDADHRDVVNEGGVHSLLIRNPQLGPIVEYTCIAKNKFGEAPLTVHLSVVERGSNIPPYFIEQLYNIIIIEGQDARLDACAQGFPEPKVAWEKEGQPLTPNKEYKVEFEGAKTTLYIRGAKMTDAGWYQCTATSPAGTCLTKCKVTVIPLSEAGQYAKDLPQFGPQQLNKIPSLPEEDIRSKYMTVPVKPPEVKPEELYKLPKRIKKPDSALEDAKRRGIKVLPDEVLIGAPGNLEEFPEEEMYSKDRPQPPKFKVHIKSHLNLNEDEPCLFEAKLIPARDPMMRVQWFKNGKVLHHASRMIPRYDFADVSLEFLWTFAEDDGIYECVATNPYGEDRTRAELKCRPKRSIIYNTQLPEGMEGVSKLQMLEDEIRYTASMIGLEEKVQEKEPKIPEFIMPLVDISIDEGDNAKFIAKVDGHPRPRITWSINDSDIANGSRYKLVYDGLVHYLDIPRTRQYDAGIVRCIAKNSLGQTESVASLNLRLRTDYRSAVSKGPGTIDTGLDDSFDVDIEERMRLRSQLRQIGSIDERARRPSVEKLIHPLHSKVTDRMAWRQTVEKAGEAPNFTRPLLPLKAKEGSKVVVNVEFTGEPAPTVSWYRDGFMVEDSEDFKIHTTPTQSILTIKHAFIIDSGLYTVKLFNPIGIRQCQAAIRIMPIIAEDQTPRFLDVPQDSEVLAGDPVRCQCRVEGEPFPTVAFYREDEPINLNDKRFRVIQEGDVFTLLLFEALPADSGQYEAVAENPVGKANTRFTLIVTPRVPGGKKASIIDDPKLIHKVPYLEKPLEDLHVKEGQSATFECIIPASFGSDVKWYKGTSEWTIKPSKFFKPKSDGTKHQLFILEAYAEDEGLYKCVVSNPVGTTATTATLKVDHTMQVPEFIRGFSNLTTYEGEQVRFEVEVRGDPPPTLSWYRDGEIIRDSPDFQIFTEGTRSLFYIAEVFMEDQGLFTCTASNSAGSSDCSARLIVEPRPQL